MKTNRQIQAWLRCAAAMLLALAGNLNTVAQEIEGGEAFYIYQNDGHFDGFFYDQVKQINYSRYDTLGVEYDKYVSQEIVTEDSVYRIMLSAIDSVSFVQPEIKYAEGVRFMRDEGMLAYYQSISIPDDDSFQLRFSGSMPAALQPKVGDVLSCPDLKDYDEAFVGKVKKVRTEGGDIVVECGYIDDLKDVFEQFITVEQVRNVQTPEGAKTRRRMAGINAPKREGNFSDVVLFNFNTSIEGNISVSDNLKFGIGLNVGFGMTATVAYNISWKDFYIKTVLKDQIAAGFTVSLDGQLYDKPDLSALPGVGALVEKFSRIPFPAAFPILYANMVPTPFARVEAHLNVNMSTGVQVKGTSFMLEIKDKWPYVDMGVNLVAPFLPYEIDGEKSFSINAQINGMAQTGMKFPIEVGTNSWIKKVCSLKAGTTVYAGPKITGQLNFDLMKETDGMYELMKDTKVDLSLMSIDTEYEAEGSLWNKKTELKSSSSWTFGNYTLNLFPAIENTETSLAGDNLDIVKCKYEVSGEVFLPQTLGFALYSKEHENTIYYKKLYKSVFRDETYFLNTFNKVNLEIPDVEPGEYRLRPVIKSFLGLVPVYAEEKVVYVDPNELLLKPDRIMAEEEEGVYTTTLVTKKDSPITPSTDDPWITTEIVKPSGNQKYYTMKVKVSENNTDAYRTGKVTVRQQFNEKEYDEKVLTVNQYGGLQLSKSKIDFGNEGGEITIDILTSYKPITVDLNGAEDWLSYNLDDRKLTITAKPNQGGNRTAIIIITAWSKKKNQYVEVKLTVTQKGIVDAAIDPTELSFEETGGTQRVNVTLGPNTKFTKVSVRDKSDIWVLVEKADDHFNVTAIPNEDEKRTAYVDATFTTEGKDGKTYTATLPVTISQEGVVYATITPSEITLPASGGYQQVLVSMANYKYLKYRIEGNAKDWLSVSEQKEDEYNSVVLTVTASESSLTENRVGIITVFLSETPDAKEEEMAQATITVTQEAKADQGEVVEGLINKVEFGMSGRARVSGEENGQPISGEAADWGVYINADDVSVTKNANGYHVVARFHDESRSESKVLDWDNAKHDFVYRTITTTWYYDGVLSFDIVDIENGYEKGRILNLQASYKRDIRSEKEDVYTDTDVLETSLKIKEMTLPGPNFKSSWTAPSSTVTDFSSSWIQTGLRLGSLSKTERYYSLNENYDYHPTLTINASDEE